MTVRLERGFLLIGHQVSLGVIYFYTMTRLISSSSRNVQPLCGFRAGYRPWIHYINSPVARAISQIFYLITDNIGPMLHRCRQCRRQPNGDPMPCGKQARYWVISLSQKCARCPRTLCLLAWLIPFQKLSWHRLEQVETRGGRSLDVSLSGGFCFDEVTPPATMLPTSPKPRQHW